MTESKTGESRSDMIKAENLKFRYDKKKSLLITDVNIEVKEGYMTVVIGHNAGGKSTLFKLLYGALIPESGSIYYGFSDDDAYPEDERKQVKLDFDTTAAMRRKTAMISEEMPMFSTLDISQNIELYASLYPEFDREEFEKLSKDMGLTGGESRERFYKFLPTELSTGEYVKFKLCLAFARHPKLMIMDEPFANLDPVVKTDILELLQARIAKENTGILLSTHLLEEINDAADYIYVIENGRIVKSGDRESLLSEEGVNELRKLL